MGGERPPSGEARGLCCGLAPQRWPAGRPGLCREERACVPVARKGGCRCRPPSFRVPWTGLCLEPCGPLFCRLGARGQQPFHSRSGFASVSECAVCKSERRELHAAAGPAFALRFPPGRSPFPGALWLRGSFTVLVE